jgi:hypothetical protein
VPANRRFMLPIQLPTAEATAAKRAARQAVGVSSPMAKAPANGFFVDY